MGTPIGKRSRNDGNLNKILALKKAFILDASALLHDADCLSKFEGHAIVIPGCVIEELDKFKSRTDIFAGRNAKQVSQYIDSLRSNNGGSSSLHKGVRTASGGMLFIDFNGNESGLLPQGLERNNDNRILSVAAYWKKIYRELTVVLVSKYPNLRIKADACGIIAQDYVSDKVVAPREEVYSGYAEITLPAEAAYLVEALDFLEPGGSMDIDKFGDLIDFNEFYPNHCCRIEAEGKYALAIYKKAQKTLRKVSKPRSKDKNSGAINPINDRQACADGLMCDPGIKLVTLIGKPGSGKTLISLKAGFKQSQYTRLSVLRPIYEASKDFGTLPGGIDGKMGPWAVPIIDAFNLILRREHLPRVAESAAEDDSPKQRKARKRDRKSAKTSAGTTRMTTAKQYMDADRLQIGPINYLRGRTFWDYEFVIIDEGQNFTPKEALFVITRAGEGCKMILEGDVTQIDNPYVGSDSCGLYYIANAFKDEEITGHIILTEGERSQLANMAAQKAGN